MPHLLREKSVPGRHRLDVPGGVLRNISVNPNIPFAVKAMLHLLRSCIFLVEVCYCSGHVLSIHFSPLIQKNLYINLRTDELVIIAIRNVKQSYIDIFCRQKSVNLKDLHLINGYKDYDKDKGSVAIFRQAVFCTTLNRFLSE